MPAAGLVKRQDAETGDVHRFIEIVHGFRDGAVETFYKHVIFVWCGPGVTETAVPGTVFDLGIFARRAYAYRFVIYMCRFEGIAAVADVDGVVESYQVILAIRVCCDFDVAYAEEGACFGFGRREGKGAGGKGIFKPLIE